MTATSSGFEHLPDVSFVDTDPAEVEASTIRLFESMGDETLHPGNPKRILSTVLSAKIAQLLVMIDQTGKQNLLGYADANNLPHLGALLDVRQLGAEFAESKESFTIAEPVDFNVVIPTGTRVTPDAQLYFATTEEGVILAGRNTITLPIKAIQPGKSSNGLEPGQINKLVDPLPVVVKVANTTKSSGGDEVEDLEAYRYRILLAPERFSCAGPELAYKFHAMSARPGLSDVEVFSPTPGVVQILLLLTGGQIPDADGPECTAVLEALSASKIRPLTDSVQVLPAEAFDFDYRFTYYLKKEQANLKSILESNIRDAAAAWEAWQVGKIGRDINDDRLKAVCQSAQAKRIVAERVWRDDNDNVIRAEPMTFTPLAGNQVARIRPIQDKDIPDTEPSRKRIVFGGLEDE